MRESNNALAERIEMSVNALRAEMRAGDNALAKRIEASVNALRAEMRESREESNSRINTQYIVIAAGWATIMAAFIALFIRG